MPDQCPVSDCPAQRRKCGCGYLIAGTPCRHPKRREEWERKRDKIWVHESQTTDGQLLAAAMQMEFELPDAPSDVRVETDGTRSFYVSAAWYEKCSLARTKRAKEAGREPR